MDQEFFLVQLFDSIISQKQEIRDPANESIMNLIETEPMKFLFLSSQIILTDGFPDSIYRMSFTLMGHTLTPSIKVPLNLISSTFLNPENIDQRNIIKQAALRGLMFKDQIIRQQASNCISLLLQIETEKWPDLFPQLFEIANSYSIEARCGAIYCFGNIVSSNIPFNFISEFVFNFYFFIIHCFTSTEITSEYFFDECFKCYLSILSRLQESNNIDNNIADKCFEIIEKSISLYGLAKSRFYFLSLFSLFKGIYSTSILDYISRYLDLSTKVLEIGEFDQQIDVFIFWTKIARYEFDQQIRRNIINSVAQSFFPVIFKMIFTCLQKNANISEFFDSTVDDEYSIGAFNTGSNCLSAFYKVAPETIFECVSQLWSNEFTSTDQVICALIALIPIIRKKPEYLPLINFLERREIKDIIFPLIIHENEIISILALVLIQKSVYKFGCFIREPNDFNTLFALMRQISANNSNTIYYCCQIIFKICKYNFVLIKQRLMDLDNSYIARNFEQMMETMNFYISQANTYKNILVCFSAFSCFIHLIPNSQIHLLYNIQEDIVKKTIVRTLSSQNEISYEIKFALQTSMIDLIQTIADRLNVSQIPLQNADELIRLLFTISKQQKTEVYEEILSPLSSIIICMKGGYAPYAEETMNLILEIIQSGSANAIQLSVLTISDLFRELQLLMKPYSDPIFKILIPLIYNGNLNRELVVNIIMTLSDITRSINEISVDNKNEFFKVILQLVKTVNLNPSEKNDRDFISWFFQSILYSFSLVIDFSYDDQNFATIQYKEVFLPLIDLYIKTNIIDDRSLYAFLLFVQSLRNMYGKLLLKPLNARPVQRLIKLAMNSKNTKLSVKAEKLSNDLIKLPPPHFQ